MADSVKTYKRVKLQAAFDDGDTRVITLDNARSDLTEAEITDLNDEAIAVLIGDKAGGTCIGFIAAKYVDGTETTLDLT